MLRAVPLLAALAISVEPAPGPKASLDFTATPSLEQLCTVKLLPVSPDIAAHRVVAEDSIHDARDRA